jgi:hypothetical protein
MKKDNSDRMIDSGILNRKANMKFFQSWLATVLTYQQVDSVILLLLDVRGGNEKHKRFNLKVREA